MEQWKEYRLGEICESVSESYRGKAEKVVLINTSDVLEGECLNHSKVPNKELKGQFKKTFKENDILYSEIRPVNRRYAYIDFFAKDYIASTKLMVLRHNEKVLPKYLYYILQSKDMIEELQMLAEARSGTFPQITFDVLSKECVMIPNINTQEKILAILTSLDNKIQLNRKINSNLEEQAKALFKSWFIDFEPFKDGKFVDSELGKIPEGWEVVTIGDVTENIKDKVGDRDNIKVLSPITSGQLVLSEDYFSKQVFSNSIAKYIVVKHNDFAYNPARINIGSIGMNEFNFDGCVSPVYVVFRCQKGYEYFFNLYRRTTFFAEEVKKRAIGGVRQTLSYKDLSLIQLVYPPQKVVDNFNSIIISLLHTIHSNDVSNKKLEAIRDLLLPRLMSGEINVRL